MALVSAGAGPQSSATNYNSIFTLAVIIMRRHIYGFEFIVGSRLDYAKSVNTGISARNIHRLQRVQNSLARVVTRSTINSTSSLNSLHWLPLRLRIV